MAITPKSPLDEILDPPLESAVLCNQGQIRPPSDSDGRQHNGTSNDFQFNIASYLTPCKNIQTAIAGVFSDYEHLK